MDSLELEFVRHAFMAGFGAGCLESAAGPVPIEKRQALIDKWWATWKKKRLDPEDEATL